MVTNLIGYWEHGRDVEQIWRRAHRRKKLAIYDENPDAGILPPKHINGPVIFGMNNPQQRERASVRFPHAARPLIDPAAIIGDHIEIEHGVVIAPSTLLHGIYLGSHVHVHYGVHMTRAIIESFTTISPGATICGDVYIQTAVLIGAGATLCNGVSIGHNAIVAAGAVVPPFTDIGDNEIWAGVPAKKIDKDPSSVTVLHRYRRGDDA